MGKLFYIFGASGAGKDTLMNYARSKINGSEKIIFAHRYITKSAFECNENHIYLSPTEFRLKVETGLFAMTRKATVNITELV